ncbi:beta-1,3-galactosyltransferase 5-like [Convolutriloba macropyga]|uniref:beta-1,3-galactosyltransferase 5-like n=1 Tax=Convolutriloba macropyga TaxID=536237 RepID=UPI003F52304A
MMIAIMVISKFCPDTKYVIKTDDDVYLRLAKLEQVVVKLQQTLNKKASENGPRGQKKLPRTDVSLWYSGVLCENYTALRSGRWAVRKEEYPFPNYPLYFQSSGKSAADEPSRAVHNHCVALQSAVLHFTPAMQNEGMLHTAD